MGNDLTIKNDLPQQLNETQLNFIGKKTPRIFIKTRPGRGGSSFNYVEVGYVMEMLNSLFGFGAWDWEYSLVEQLSFPHTSQVVLNGKLTVRIYDPQTADLKGTIIKTASGGGEVKFPIGIGTKPIDLADDVKSASADALKKAASMIGIAADVYYPNIYSAKNKIKQNAPSDIKQSGTLADVEYLEEKDQEDINEADQRQVKIGLQRKIFAIAKDLATKGKIHLLGLTDEEKKAVIKKFLASRDVIIESFGAATIEKLELAVEVLNEANK